MHARRLLLICWTLAGVAALAVAQEETPQPPAGDDPAAPEAATEEPPAREPFTGSAAELAAAHTDVRLRSIGRSAGDRPLELLEVGPPDATWAALLVAGLHGRRDRDECRLALDVAAWLAEHATELPRDTTFLVLPDANPDATAAATSWSRAGNDRPVDEDGDGDVDEDGPDDVTGDGTISWMRYPDPTGGWAFDEPGVPKRAEPEKGVAATHRIVPEGRDDDGDGAWNEDGPGGVDLARNFTWAFEEHVAPAGRWPASESGTRAVMDLLLADERIALVHELGGDETIVKAPPWSAAWQKLADEDAALLDGLRELHPAGAVEERTPHAPGAGSLGGAVWHQLGRIWTGRSPLGRSGPVWPDGESSWPEHLAVKWEAVSGDGLPPGAEVVATLSVQEDAEPPDVIAETESIGVFLRDVAAGRARVAFTDTAAAGESGVLRLRTRLVNTGRLPTHTARGAELRARRPLNIRIVVPDGARLAGGRPLVQIERLAPGAASDELAWVVAGLTGHTVRVEVTGPDTGTVVLEEMIP